MDTLKLIRNSSLALAVAVLLGSAPAQARPDGMSWEPKVGLIGSQEEQLAQELVSDFNSHFIDSFELANLTRNLDVIRVKEDALRMNHNGLSKKDEARILKMLARFQQDLNKATSDKSYTLAEAPMQIAVK